MQCLVLLYRVWMIIYRSKITKLAFVNREVSRKCTSQFSENRSQQLFVYLTNETTSCSLSTSVFKKVINLKILKIRRNRMGLKITTIESKSSCSIALVSGMILSPPVSSAVNVIYINKRFRFQSKRESSPWCRNFKLD